MSNRLKIYYLHNSDCQEVFVNQNHLINVAKAQSDYNPCGCCNPLVYKQKTSKASEAMYIF